ncbi:MAG: nucleotidyltransferase family protein [Planctomycetes bacterium]|nr:nucleotidyltransferase family protein [Planctomycetota bacterium]
MTIAIPIDYKTIAEFCVKNHIRKMALYGSVVRDDFDPARSDIDILVEFEPGHVIGLKFVTIADDLEVLFERKVDLSTFRALNPDFREEVLREVEVIYDASKP